MKKVGSRGRIYISEPVMWLADGPVQAHGPHSSKHCMGLHLLVPGLLLDRTQAYADLTITFWD
jgi:hypothetical protein